MRKIKSVVAMLLYYSVAYYLPNSSFPGGSLFNWLRVALLRQFLTIGKNCRVMKGVYVGNGKSIVIGDYCKINDYVRLNNVIIGNHVLIARESIILGKMHEYKDLNIEIAKQGNRILGPTIIGDGTWIGLRCIIFPELKIGKNAIIAAGAVLTKNVSDYDVFGGVPAKFIKNRKNGEQ
ncbi:MAG: acyltransferase [Bacteroidota bacterium]|jgi:maltose O-acetyltransferase